jgi:predicted permease
MQARLAMWLSRIRGFFSRRGLLDEDFDQELRSHLEMLADRYVAEGLTRDQAVRAARGRLGGVAQLEDFHRDQRSLPALDALLRDVRDALRGCRHKPGLTFVIVSTLALAIGANSAVYTVADRVLLRPLPYPDPERLATIARYAERDGEGRDDYSQNGATWFALRDRASSIELAASGSSNGVNLVAHGQPMYVEQARVSAGFFRVLGLRPVLGREFTPEEDRANGPAVVILSEPFWRRAFAGEAGVLGTALTLRGEPYTVIGVMPAGLGANTRTDVWTPLRPSTTGEGGGVNYRLVARLRPGAAWPEADAQVTAVGEALMRELDVRLPPGVSMRLRLAPLQQGLTAQFRQPLVVLWGAVVAVLLVCCVNVAGLLLARGSDRAPEVAVRLALGGGRGVIIRQLFVESLVLAGCGGLLGLALGRAILYIFAAQFQALLGSAPPMDVRVVAVTAAAALLTSLVFGLYPAWQASRVDVRGLLVDSGSPTIAGASSQWPRRALILTEVTISVVLVVSAGLFVRTLVHLTRLEPGFDATNVTTATLSLQDARYETPQAVTDLFDRSLQEIRSLPGVEHAAVALTLPYERALNNPVRFVDRQGDGQITDLIYVTPEYFALLRIPLRQGRPFTESDTARSAPVAIVNEAFVRRYAPEENPLARSLQLGSSAPATEVVGIVGDILQQRPGWGEFGPLAAVPTVYVPAAQVRGFGLMHTWFSPSWLVRTARPQPEIAGALQAAVGRVDALLPFRQIRAVGDVRADAMIAPRGQALFSGLLAAVAAVLANVGLFGLVASSVAVRRREIGIRVAFGATPLQGLRAAALPGLLLGAAGVAAGLLLARSVAGVMRGLVFGVPVTDPVTFAIAAALALVVAAVAAVVPSLRLLNLDVMGLLSRR